MITKTEILKSIRKPVTARGVAEKFGTSRQNARLHLLHLTRDGLLVQMDDGTFSRSAKRKK